MDNPPDQGFTPNQSAHIHHYVPKGSGLSCWAECDGFVPLEPRYGARAATRYAYPCREKLCGDNGPIVGSRAKIEKAMP